MNNRIKLTGVTAHPRQRRCVAIINNGYRGIEPFFLYLSAGALGTYQRVNLSISIVCIEPAYQSSTKVAVSARYQYSHS